jgi:RND family efflux transporter MFP subunit
VARERLVADPDRLDQLRIDRSADTPRPMWGRSAALLASLLVVAGAAWWIFGGPGAIEVEAAQVVELGGSARGGGSVLDASGYVVARRAATVSSKITGRLVDVAIEEGMSVQEGQVLARLDPANARRALELSEATVVAARSALHEIQVRLREAALELGRAKELAASGVASQSLLDAAQAEHDSLAARLAAARDEVRVAEGEAAVRRQELEDTLIRAPFDGVAISKDAQPGEIVSPVSAGGGFTRTGIGTIVDMSSLEIEVDVNEAYIQRIEPGQPVVATLDAYADWKIPARVITTVPAADRQKATVRVRIAFEELGDPRILPDMGVKVGFQAPQGETPATRPGLAVPQRAIRRDGGSAVAFVLRDGRVERRAVAVGAANGDGVEVLSGLRAGETVVLDPPADLADGSRVELRGGRS